MDALTHLNAHGEARMVDVGDKDVSSREAVAEGSITMPPDLIDRLETLKKGNAFEIARIAGIMADKKTHELIPLCHVLMLDTVAIAFTPDREAGRVHVTGTARCQGRTGVEMEALTAVSVALLTLYDMGKAVARDMEIGQIRLVAKTGGKSGDWQRQPRSEVSSTLGK